MSLNSQQSLAYQNSNNLTPIYFPLLTAVFRMPQYEPKKTFVQIKKIYKRQKMANLPKLKPNHSNDDIDGTSWRKCSAITFRSYLVNFSSLQSKLKGVKIQLFPSRKTTKLDLNNILPLCSVSRLKTEVMKYSYIESLRDTREGKYGHTESTSKKRLLTVKTTNYFHYLRQIKYTVSMYTYYNLYFLLPEGRDWYLCISFILPTSACKQQPSMTT